MGFIKEYRVVKKGGLFAVHEVVCDAQGNPTAISTDPSVPSGATFAEIAQNVRKYSAAIQKPVLDYRMIVKTSKPDGSATS